MSSEGRGKAEDQEEGEGGEEEWRYIIRMAGDEVDGSSTGHTRAYWSRQVEDPLQKAEIRKARDVILNEHYDLKLIRDDSTSSFLVGKGIKGGTAKRFRRDIPSWNKRRKTGNEE